MPPKATYRLRPETKRHATSLHHKVPEPRSSDMSSVAAPSATLNETFTAPLLKHWRALALCAEPPRHSSVLCQFDNVHSVLTLIRAWRNAPVKPPVLHLIGVIASDNHAEADLAHWLKVLATELHIPGFDCLQARPYVQDLLQNPIAALVPLHTDNPHLHLWLSAQPLSQLLRDQTLALDALLWPELQDPYGPRLLARAVRHNALLLVRHDLPQDKNALEAREVALRQAGFVRQTHAFEWRFAPRWSPRSRNAQIPTYPPAPGHGQARHAVVVGAGLAGACSAWQLATRGWQVTVLDEAEDMAQGASDLPAGVLGPVTAASSPLSDVSQLGVWASVQLCQALQVYGLREGRDFSFTGVLQKSGHDGLSGPTQRWHPVAGWIKPRRLVQACLSHPGIRWQARTQVVAITQEETTPGSQTIDAPSLNAPVAQDFALPIWTAHVLEKGTSTTFMAHLLVVANAHGAPSLLAESATHSASTWVWMPCPPLASVGGQMTYGVHQGSTRPTDWPAFPINGRGHVMGGIPMDDPTGSSAPVWAWMAGATYHPRPNQTADRRTDTLCNLATAAALMPEKADFFEAPQTLADAQTWTGARCVTPDRLPLVGVWPISGCENPPLSLIGLGSRGLSLAALSAHLLAAQLHQEPLPLPKRLVKVLSPSRYI